MKPYKLLGIDNQMREESTEHEVNLHFRIGSLITRTTQPKYP